MNSQNILRSIIVYFVLISVIACCKETPIVDDDLVGVYNIVKIDSCHLRTDNVFYTYTSLQDTASIRFEYDQRGSFSRAIPSISGNETQFIWTHIKGNEEVIFSFSNGTTDGLFGASSGDTLVLFFKDYLNQEYLATPYWYKFYLIKNK